MTATFLFYDWGHFEPGGMRETLFQLQLFRAQGRSETVERYRIEDERRQLANVRHGTAEIDRINAELDLPQSDEERDQLHQLLALAIRRKNLAEAWLRRSPQEREPAGRMPASWTHQQEHLLEQERRIRERSKALMTFLASGKHLPEAETARAAWNRMADADYCGCHAHRLQVEHSGHRWSYDPEHVTRLPSNAELFEIRFRQALMDTARIPTYAATTHGSCLEIVHARLFDRLPVSDYDLLAQFGLRLASHFDFEVRWAGDHAPAQWEIEDENAQATRPG